jgi:hypothetical protein
MHNASRAAWPQQRILTLQVAAGWVTCVVLVQQSVKRGSLTL